MALVHHVVEPGIVTGLPTRMMSLGGGLVVPYPKPVNGAATRFGKGNRRTNTGPEIRLRSSLHRRGLRFRKDSVVRTPTARVRADVVFPAARVAVFVDGCFWHGCPEHQRVPRRNAEYWGPKLQRNAARDHDVNAALVHAGWHVERIWEHEDPSAAAERVERAVRSRRVSGGSGKATPRRQ